MVALGSCSGISFQRFLSGSPWMGRGGGSERLYGAWVTRGVFLPEPWRGLNRSHCCFAQIIAPGNRSSSFARCDMYTIALPASAATFVAMILPDGWLHGFAAIRRRAVANTSAVQPGYE